MWPGWERLADGRAMRDVVRLRRASVPFVAIVARKAAAAACLLARTLHGCVAE